MARALDAGDRVESLFVCHERLTEDARAVIARARASGIQVRDMAARVFDRLAGREDAAGLLALIALPAATDLDGLLARRGAIWLLVDTAYPGNAGFAIRTAEVSGASGVVVDAGFDRNERREAVRAGLRADRLFPVLFESADAVVTRARAQDLRIVGVEDVGDRAPWQVDLTGSCLFLLGGEQAGLREGLQAQCDAIVRIPMPGFIPAYNLQAAMAMVVGERLRQQTAGAPGA